MAAPSVMQADCAGADGAPTTIPFVIDHSSVDEARAAAAKPPVQKVLRVRPALAEADLDRLSDEELLTGGYFARPDRATQPDAYAAWAKQATRSMDVVPLDLTNIAPIHREATDEFSDLTGSNWSGYSANGPKGTFADIQGTWNVPSVVSNGLKTATGSAVWVGLDGRGLGDLLQAGTNQDVEYANGVYTTHYIMFAEYVPGPAMDLGWVTQAGDVVSYIVYMGDANGNLSATGTFLWLWASNSRLNKVGLGSIAKPAGAANPTGQHALWMVERPTRNGGLIPLAPYRSTLMSGAEAKSATGNWYYFSQFSLDKFTMTSNGYSSGRTLSSVQPVSGYPDEMLFQWSASQ
jgi:hypothetical protein